MGARADLCSSMCQYEKSVRGVLLFQDHSAGSSKGVGGNLRAGRHI